MFLSKFNNQLELAKLEILDLNNQLEYVGRNYYKYEVLNIALFLKGNDIDMALSQHNIFRAYENCKAHDQFLIYRRKKKKKKNNCISLFFFFEYMGAFPIDTRGEEETNIPFKYLIWIYNKFKLSINPY